MNERETDAYVKKENVWKRPDYQAIIDDGVPADIVFFIKSVRDSLPTKPLNLWSGDSSETRANKLKAYIQTVNHIKNHVETIRERKDVLDAFQKIFVEPGYVEETRNFLSMALKIIG